MSVRGEALTAADSAVFSSTVKSGDIAFTREEAANFMASNAVHLRSRNHQAGTVFTYRQHVNIASSVIVIMVACE